MLKSSLTIQLGDRYNSVHLKYNPLIKCVILFIQDLAWNVWFIRLTKTQRNQALEPEVEVFWTKNHYANIGSNKTVDPNQAKRTTKPMNPCLMVQLGSEKPIKTHLKPKPFNSGQVETIHSSSSQNLYNSYTKSTTPNTTHQIIVLVPLA